MRVRKRPARNALQWPQEAHADLGLIDDGGLVGAEVGLGDE